MEPDGDSVAHAVVIPKQVNRPRNYSISTSAMQEVGAVARPQAWTVVAAVHSHPGISVEHSEYDDEMAPSRRALSIVFANYAAYPVRWPIDVGMHEFIDNYWHLLPHGEAADRLLFDGDVEAHTIDLR